MTDSPPIRTDVNKIENRITFKFKVGCFLELLKPETMKLPRSIKNKVTKDKNSENMTPLKLQK